MMASETPSSEWELDRLADYARKLVKRVRMAPRRVAKDVFRMGQALVIVRDKLKAEGEYGRWCATNKIPKTTAHHAVKLFEFYGTEDKLRGKTIAVAKRECGLIRPKFEGKASPAWLPENTPKSVVKLVNDMDAVRSALPELDKLDRGVVAKLAEELAELSREVAGLVREKTKGRKSLPATH